MGVAPIVIYYGRAEALRYMLSYAGYLNCGSGGGNMARILNQSHVQINVIN